MTDQEKKANPTIEDLLENPFDSPSPMPELEPQTVEQEEKIIGKTYDHLP